MKVVNTVNVNMSTVHEIVNTVNVNMFTVHGPVRLAVYT